MRSTATWNRREHGTDPTDSGAGPPAGPGGGGVFLGLEHRYSQRRQRPARRNRGPRRSVRPLRRSGVRRHHDEGPDHQHRILRARTTRRGVVERHDVLPCRCG